MLTSLVELSTAQGIVEAVKKGDVARVKHFLQQDCSLASTDPDEATGTHSGNLISYATTLHRTVIVKMLLDCGVLPDTRSEPLGFTPLMIASLFGDVPTVTLLLERGANVNLRSNEGEIAALHCAAQGGHVSIARMLLNHGANQNIRDMNGETPMDYAVRFDQTDFELFLRKYEPPKTPAEKSDSIAGIGDSVLLQRNGETALKMYQTALTLSPNPELLWKIGNAYDSLQNTQDALDAYGKAISTSQRQTAFAVDKAYLSRGRVLFRSGRYEEAIKDFETEGSDEGFKEFGTVDTNKLLSLGSAALRYAMMAPDVNMTFVERLIRSGLGINDADSIGVTPLDAFALSHQSGDIAPAKFLVDNGANPLAKTKEGETALDIATRRGFSYLINYLRSIRMTIADSRPAAKIEVLPDGRQCFMPKLGETFDINGWHLCIDSVMITFSSVDDSENYAWVQSKHNPYYPFTPHYALKLHFTLTNNAIETRIFGAMNLSTSAMGLRTTQQPSHTHPSMSWDGSSAALRQHEFSEITHKIYSNENLRLDPLGSSRGWFENDSWLDKGDFTPILWRGSYYPLTHTLIFAGSSTVVVLDNLNIDSIKLPNER